MHSEENSVIALYKRDKAQRRVIWNVRAQRHARERRDGAQRHIIWKTRAQRRAIQKIRDQRRTQKGRDNA